MTLAALLLLASAAWAGDPIDVQPPTVGQCRQPWGVCLRKVQQLLMSGLDPRETSEKRIADFTEASHLLDDTARRAPEDQREMIGKLHQAVDNQLQLAYQRLQVETAGQLREAQKDASQAPARPAARPIVNLESGGQSVLPSRHDVLADLSIRDPRSAPDLGALTISPTGAPRLAEAGPAEQISVDGASAKFAADQARMSADLFQAAGGDGSQAGPESPAAPEGAGGAGTGPRSGGAPAAVGHRTAPAASLASVAGVTSAIGGAVATAGSASVRTGAASSDSTAAQIIRETAAAIAGSARGELNRVEGKLARGAQGKESGKAYAKVAQGYASLGDHPSALRAVNEAIKLDPKNAEALDLRAALRAEAGDKEGAAADARAALAINPSDTAAQLILGHGVGAGLKLPKEGALGEQEPSGGETAVRATPEQRKKADEALASAAAGIGPKDTPADKAQALLQSAVRKLGVGDIQGSLLDVSRALSLDPKTVHAWILRAHISNLPSIHNYAAALADAEKALALDPKNSSALFEKGYAQLLSGEAEDAVRTLARGVEAAPQSAMGHLFLAMALEKAGAKEEALAEYARAAALDASIKPVAEEAAARSAEKPGPAPSGSWPVLPVVGVGAALGLAAAGLSAWRRRGAGTARPSVDF